MTSRGAVPRGGFKTPGCIDRVKRTHEPHTRRYGAFGKGRVGVSLSWTSLRLRVSASSGYVDSRRNRPTNTSDDDNHMTDNTSDQDPRTDPSALPTTSRRLEVTADV